MTKINWRDWPWIVMIMALLFVMLPIQWFPQKETNPERQMTFVTLIGHLKAGIAKDIILGHAGEDPASDEMVARWHTEIGTEKIPRRYFAFYSAAEGSLIAKYLDKHEVPHIRKPLETSFWTKWGTTIIMLGGLLVVYVVAMRIVLKQGMGKNSFATNRAKLQGEKNIKITFNDVAGIDEAKEEVKELVDFLRDPTKFRRLGGKIPRGVLMIGQPGTGKTLLAKAIAGEASVPFFTISGSDFVEMFVGVGASRVRGMFEQAKKHAPCIVFIDEIDAVGRHRGAGLGGGHDEREQTLNQLLVEMDGFEGNEGVIIIAATNRPDVLDPALLRPGRFDRQVVIPLPDIRGREQILRVHMRKISTPDETLETVVSAMARSTPGFSGADLANLVNEAALSAARSNKQTVELVDFEKAKDKILMGAERKTMIMTDDDKRATAYHEAGHAIVGRLVPSHDPVYKVSIIPRGRALGVTMFVPERDHVSHSKEFLESRISSLMGGRVAEELFLGPDLITTGASNDIERATEIARNMVTKWGLSEKLGPLAYSDKEGEVFLGHSVAKHKSISDVTAREIDEEVRAIVERNCNRARDILRAHIDKLHAMADALVQLETIEGHHIDAIMTGKPLVFDK